MKAKLSVGAIALACGVALAIVHEALGRLCALVDVVGVLAAGPLVDHVSRLVDGVANLVGVLAGELLGLVEQAH